MGTCDRGLRTGRRSPTRWVAPTRPTLFFWKIWTVISNRLSCLVAYLLDRLDPPAKPRPGCCAASITVIES